MTEQEPVMLTSMQARTRLRVSREKLRGLIVSGQLTAVKVGDAPNAPYRISEEALDEYLTRQTVKPVAS